MRGSIAGVALLEGESDHSGISVVVFGTTFSDVTNSLGEFKITGIPTGLGYSITTSKDNFDPVTTGGIEVEANTETDVGIIQLPAQLGSVKGIVTKEGSSLHFGITVAIKDNPSLNAPTAFDGSYFISGVPPGPHTLSASASLPWFPADSPGPVTVLAATTVTADTFELPAAPLSPIVENAYPINSSAIAVVWSPNTEPDLQGYNLYYGSYSDTTFGGYFPDDYTPANGTIIPFTEDTWVVNGLTKGNLYSFKVTAVDIGDRESEESERQIDQFIFPRPADQSRLELGGSINKASGLGISNDGGKIFVTSLNGVFVYGTTSAPQQLGYIPFSNSPIRIAMNPADDTKAYVLDVNGDISTIDTGALTIIAPVINTGSGDPRDIIVSTDGSLIYFSDGISGSVIIFDTASGNEDPSSPIFYSGFDPAGLAIANNKLYIVDSLFDFVSVIDLSDYSELTTIDVGTTPYWATVSTNGYLYVANFFSANVTVINTSDDTVEKTIDVGSGPGGDLSFGSRGIVASGNIVYVLNKIDSNLSIISTITNEVISCTIPNGCPSSTPMDASEIVVTPDGNRIYISEFVTGGNVKIYDYSYDLTP